MQLENGRNRRIYVWGRPATETSSTDFKNLQNLSLNLVSNNAVFDILDNFTVFNPGEERFELVRDSQMPVDFSISSIPLAEVQLGTPDAVSNLSAAIAQPSSYVGIGSNAPDNACFGSAGCLPAWLIASFELTGVKESGTAEVRLQIGDLGMNHAGERSEDTLVVFGASTAIVYNGKNNRSVTLSGDTADLLVNAIPFLPGDYNGDGSVGMADYTVWRDNLGSPAGTLLNDPATTAIGTEQYATWLANFGNTSSPSMSAASQTVPEPTGALYIAAGVAVLAGSRCNARKMARTA